MGDWQLQAIEASNERIAELEAEVTLLRAAMVRCAETCARPSGVCIQDKNRWWPGGDLFERGVSEDGDRD